MLRGAGKTFFLVKSIDVLTRNRFISSPNSNCFVYNSVKSLSKNVRPNSFAVKGYQKNLLSIEPKNVMRLHVKSHRKARILGLIKRIQSFNELINARKKDRITKKSKIVLEHLLLVLKDMEKALRELRQLI